MSDDIKHECGIAMVRLLKPLDYYLKKYKNPLYGFNKLFLLMEKQHNRGQDGAGIGCVKLNVPVGSGFMFRDREIGSTALNDIFNRQTEIFNSLREKGEIDLDNPVSIKIYCMGEY